VLRAALRGGTPLQIYRFTELGAAKAAKATPFRVLEQERKFPQEWDVCIPTTEARIRMCGSASNRICEYMFVLMSGLAPRHLTLFSIFAVSRSVLLMHQHKFGEVRPTSRSLLSWSVYITSLSCITHDIMTLCTTRTIADHLLMLARGCSRLCSRFLQYTTLHSPIQCDLHRTLRIWNL